MARYKNAHQVILYFNWRSEDFKQLMLAAIEIRLFFQFGYLISIYAKFMPGVLCVHFLFFGFASFRIVAGFRFAGIELFSSSSHILMRGNRGSSGDPAR